MAELEMVVRKKERFEKLYNHIRSGSDVGIITGCTALTAFCGYEFNSILIEGSNYSLMETFAASLTVAPITTAFAISAGMFAALPGKIGGAAIGAVTGCLHEATLYAKSKIA